MVVQDKSALQRSELIFYTSQMLPFIVIYRRKVKENKKDLECPQN